MPLRCSSASAAKAAASTLCLIETRRVAGKIVTEHVGALGSVDADVSTRERLTFWAKLPQRLASLGNRVGTDQHPKIYDALHARIPMVTPDEQRAIQEENAKDDERFWDMMQGMNAAAAEEHRVASVAAEARGRSMRPPPSRPGKGSKAPRSALRHWSAARASPVGSARSSTWKLWRGRPDSRRGT
jgi:hypothetical protein